MLKTDPKFKEYTCQIIFKEVGARTGFNLDNLMEEIAKLLLFKGSEGVSERSDVVNQEVLRPTMANNSQHSSSKICSC